MTGPLIYPGADHTTQWVGKGSVTMPMNNVKWVVHTTEGTSWPSYGGSSMGSAPTLTYNPWTHQWRQHFWLNQSARALNNEVYETVNRVDVIQVEVICICEDAVADKYGHRARDIDDRAVNDLGEFGAWLMREWGMAGVFYPQALPWPAYPKGCPRMSWDKYVSYSGVLGHMAVPGNTHLDPGDLPMDDIAAVMRVDGGHPRYPQWRDEPSPAVGRMVKKLRYAGYFNNKRGDAVNYYGTYTRHAVQRFQEAQGWSGSDADGLMGPTTWERVMALPDGPQDPPPPPPEKQGWQWPVIHETKQSVGDTIRATDETLAKVDALIAAHPKWDFGPQAKARLEATRADLSGTWQYLNGYDHKK